MSHLSGPSDPDPARPPHDNPWATPSGESAPGARQPEGPPPYAAPYGPPQPYPGGYQAPRTNGKAQAALWTGLAMLVTSLCGLGVLGFIPITLGVLARREIRRSGDGQGGDGMALAGIVTGAVAIVLSLVVIALAFVVLASYDSGSSSYDTTGV